MGMKLRIGTRKSELAMTQTRWVEAELRKIDPELEIEIVSMTTIGDQILDVALSKIGEKSLFTKELERALEVEAVDLVVHSLKDLPTTLPDGMVIGAICERECPNDAVVMKREHEGKRLACLPQGSIVGTSALRRIAQLRRRYPHLVFHSVRGNLNTRLRKLDAGGGEAAFAAIVLAVAGVTRMGWAHRISAVLGADECLHAVGQGALGVECRSSDQAVLQLVGQLTHRATLLSCVAERAYLRRLEGGCSVPVAGRCRLEGDRLRLTGGVWSVDGSLELRRTLSASLPSDGAEQADGDDEPQQKRRRLSGQPHFVGVWAEQRQHAALAAAEQLGIQLADKLLSMGAGQILAAARAANEAGKYDPSKPPVKLANGATGQPGQTRPGPAADLPA